MPALVRFNLRTDVRRLRAGLDDIGQRQIPYASARAINSTLLAVQTSVRAHLGEEFTVRRAPFINNLVKIQKASDGGFATKKNPVGVIGIQGARADVLTKFEVGGTKTPRGLDLAIPRVGSIVKRKPQFVVAERYRPRALLANELLTFRAFIKTFKDDPSKRGIFIVDRQHEARLNARKRGNAARASDVRRARPQLVYTLTPQAPIPADLQFIPIAREVIGAQFVPNLRAELAKAIATARTT